MDHRMSWSPSSLWIEAAHQEGQIKGSPSLGDDQCILCGEIIHAGDPVLTPKEYFKASFTNYQDCKYPGHCVCAHCAALSTGNWMQAWSKAFAVRDEGVFWLVRGEDQAAFLLDPPQNDYVACINTRQKAHVIWRTPVARPSNYLQVRIDDQMLIIDRERALEGTRALQQGMAILKAIGQPKATLALMGHHLASISAGVIVKKYADMVEGQGEEGRAILQTLRSLTLSEWWAVAALRSIDLDHPETWPVRRPLPIMEE